MSSIKSIEKKKINKERLYNLAVEEDESFVAEGIVVHNCRSILIYITEVDRQVDGVVASPPLSAQVRENLNALSKNNFIPPVTSIPKASTAPTIAGEIEANADFDAALKTLPPPIKNEDFYRDWERYGSGGQLNKGKVNEFEEFAFRAPTQAMNALLRNPELYKDEVSAGYLKNQIKLVDSYINKADKYPGLVYRGLAFDQSKTLFEAFDKNIGEAGNYVLFKEFPSVTPNLKIAEQYMTAAENNYSAMLRIVQKNGVMKMAYPDGGLTVLTLPRNSKYKVISKKRNGNVIEVILQEI